MPTLALDLATRTGWAFRASSGEVTSGFIDCKPLRKEGDGARFLKLRRFLQAFEISNEKPDVILFEDIKQRHKSLIAARCYGGFYGEAAAFAEERGIRFVGVPVGTHKKHTTGKGNADKEATVAAIQRAGFVNVTDDNEADALSVLLTISESELLASESVKLAATKKKAGTCAASRRSKTS